MTQNPSEPQDLLAPPEPASAPAAGALPALSALTENVLPVYLALRPNLNDFTAFADGGWDGNWYVGYNNCWIVRLPPAPPGPYVKAFLGAKLGRAKVRAKPGKAFSQEPVPGSLYMAIASTPAFSSERSFFLAETRDLPLEPDPTLISGWVGQGGWLWTEIPASLVSTQTPNYLALWSNTEGLLSISSSPVLAAATADGPVPAWLNRSTSGTAPRDPASALETQLNRLMPALALKLVPPNGSSVEAGDVQLLAEGGETVARFSVRGQNIDAAWFERSYDMISWERLGPVLRHPPYAVTLPDETARGRAFYLRAAAADVLGNSGVSRPLKVGK